MQTRQKKVKFSKGQISPELVERTDLELLNSSAQKMENVVSTVYGGIRKRRGTNFISKLSVNYTDEENGTPTSYIGGTAADLTNYNTFTSSNIGTNRNICSIDYGEIFTEDVNVIVKDIKINSLFFIASYTSNGSFTLPVDKEVYIKMTGGGGGGSNLWGGRGAGIECYASLTQGTYTFVCGQGGAGADAYVRNHDGHAGTASTLTGNGLSITCGGGQGRQGRRHGGGGGYTGDLSFTFPDNYDVKNRTNNEYTNASFIDGTETGYGAGGKSQGNDTGSGYAGKNGYMSYSIGNIVVVLEKSEDGVAWEEVARKSVTTNAVDFDYFVKDFRYLRLRIDEDATFSYTGTLSLGYVKAFSSTQGQKVKLIKFVFNNKEQYIICLASQFVVIFTEDRIVQAFKITGILEDYIDDIKYTFRDDTIILTHPEMPPKQLQRQSNGSWSFGNFTMENIPYYAFNGETRTTQSVSITPSAEEGAIKITAASSIFDATWVGQKIDGNGGIARITEYVSGTVVNAVTQIPFYTTDAIASWDKISGYEAVWSVTRGYPRTCLFAQSRLWFGGSKSLPSNIWASRIDDVNNFKNSGNYDNDSIDVQLLTNDPIVNMIEQRGLHIFTTGQEWSASENSLTPNAITFTKNTQNGSLARVVPAVLGGVVIFIEKNGKSLLSYVYNYEQASYMSDNISLFSSLIRAPIALDVENNSSVDVGDFVYIVLDDGTMLVACIILSQQITSISQVTMDGKIKDVVCLPEATYILIDRDGVTYLEKFSDSKTDMTRSIYVSGDTVQNIDEYNGKEVYLYKDDDIIKKAVVSSGILELDKAYEASFNIGLAFNFEVKSNPIFINNQTMTVKKRISKASIVCKDTKELTFNGQTKINKDNYEFFACGKYDKDARFDVTGSFYPIDILSITLDINYEG